MSTIPITIAAGDYDRTRPIKDGRVPVDGCDVTYLTMEPEELFFRAIRYEEFDVCELSLSSYIMQSSKGKTGYTAIPIFLSRAFRHSGFYVRTDRGIDGPADLKGKLVGMPEYQMTACVWQRGFLKDEYGIEASDIHWRSGGQETPGREERAPITLPPDIDLQRIPDDKTLAGMLESGELDALMLPRAPSCFSASSTLWRNSFSDHGGSQVWFHWERSASVVSSSMSRNSPPRRSLTMVAPPPIRSRSSLRGTPTASSCSTRNARTEMRSLGVVGASPAVTLAASAGRSIPRSFGIERMIRMRPMRPKR